MKSGNSIDRGRLTNRGSLAREDLLSQLVWTACLMFAFACHALTIPFSTTGDLSAPRSSHTATLLPGGKVLVVGGYNGDISTSSAELYDPSNGIWTVTGSMATARYHHTATLLPNGKVLVAGGVAGYNMILSSAELYDPSNGMWTVTGTLATERHKHTATLLPNGKVLVAGGLREN